MNSSMKLNATKIISVTIFQQIQASVEGIRVYKRYYDGSRDEVTNWDFTSSPDVLYNKS